ncbi:kelch-like protein diablo isoform X1 [Homalodisca vitripennis]|uniref:kelch-like protein diablo isoform X1 n=2 Tax=Homalodisca vitripennis TaxID=197043 RepID=UPI001EEC008C|nr:kelch-like protein diablo isoform X1 [Homalodisca vitripennis]
MALTSEAIENLYYEDKLLARSILEGATYLYENNILCDVELVIEGKKIEAHKSILASASLYFRGMFCAGLKETGQREITIHDVDYDAMKSVIKFFYTSSIILTEENIFEVVNVVDLLGVASLHSACCVFLQRALTVHNCISVYVVCRLHGYADMAQRAVKLARRHFHHLMELDEFLDMPVEMLQACLEGKVLNIYSENSLLKRVCAWVKHDVEQRGRHLQGLLDNINLYTLDLGMAESSLYQLPSLEAQAYKWMERARHVRERPVTLSSRNKTRYNKEQQVVLSCGGFTGGPIANVEAFTSGDSLWRCMVPSPGQTHGFRVLPPLKQARIYAATTYTDDYVYVIGGRNDGGPLSSVERYSVEANEWDECVSLPEPLEGAAATVANNSVYVTGGFNTSGGVTNKAWVLEPGFKSWRSLPPMSHNRSHHGLLAAHGYVYAIAGAGADGGVQATVERMSTHTQHWEPLSPLQEPRSHCACVTVDTRLYVVGGLDAEGQALLSVQMYDTLQHEWSAETPLPVGRHSHGATVADGRIYVAAGSDGVHQLATCDIYNPNTRRWHCKPSLARSRVGQAMATITLPVSPPALP